MRETYLSNLRILIYVWNWFYVIWCLLLLFIDHHLLPAQFLMLFLSKKHEVLSISTFANVFVFGNFSVRHKDWLSYSDGTDRSGKLCYNFSICSDLIRWLTFLLGSLAVTLLVFLFWLYFFLLTLVFLFYCSFPTIKKS